VKAARLLRAFAEVPDDTFVWTRESDGTFRLGRIDGPWRYDASSAASEVGIHHVRATRWLSESCHLSEVPAAVAATFARGGRNFQRTHDRDAEQVTAALWQRAGPRR
jgi:predicted Mrr-cat superfamily restriction endonuclease